MTDPSDGDQQAAIRAAADSVEDAEQGSRRLTGPSRYAVAGIAAAWSVFQLALPRLVIASDYVRAIHLCFAVGLVYLSFPAFKRHKAAGGSPRRLPALDVVLAILAALAAGYYALDYEGISARQGAPLARDIVAGVVLIVLLLEAARRSLGPAMPVVAGGFILYALLGPYLPELLAFRQIGLNRMMSQLTLSTEGIYGVPLRVSAGTVFLFVLLGAMLKRTGGGRYFVQLAFGLLGRYKGGPAKAAVLSSGLTGMVSGSSIANVVTTGTFTIPLMTRSGYPPERAAAIEVAASTNGQLMPPIMGAAAFIIAEYCNLAYLDVVRAAFIPAVVSYLALIYITHLEAGKLGLKGLRRDQLPRFGSVFLGGIHFLIPLAVLVTMLLLRYSPQLSALYAIGMLAAMVLVHGVLTAGRMGLTRRRGLGRGVRLIAASLVDGGKGMMGVGVACAAAGIIVGIVAMGPGAKLTGIVATLSGGNIMLVLLLTAMASLVLGMGLPTTATYIVMASLVAEVIVTLGAAAGLEIPRIGAHLFCFYFGILADDTPPVGLAAYAAAAIARADPIATGLRGFTYDLRTAILPFFFIFNTDLLLWNVHNPWHIALIFVAATAAMCAFAALTQNFMVTRNRLHESALLVVSVLILLRPQLGAAMVTSSLAGAPAWLAAVAPESKFAWYAIGAAPLAAVYALQRLRKRQGLRD